MPLLTKRRLLWTAAAVLVLLGAVVAGRLPLTDLALRSVMNRAGATAVKFDVTAASPWTVAVENMGFSLRAQPFSARRMTLNRAHWWSPSLGALRIEQASLPLALDGIGTPAWVWAGESGGAGGASAPVSVPLDEISVDGQLVVQSSAAPDQVLTVKIDATQTAQKTWTGHASADAPGLNVVADATFDLAMNAVDFKVPAAAVDVKTWQGFVQNLLTVPAGAWEAEGKLTATAAGRFADGKLTAGGTVRLREGRTKNAAAAITAEGIEADLEFTDFVNVVSKPGTLRVRELQAGTLLLRDLDCGFAFANSNQVTVTRTTLQALGGTVAAEPFTYFLDRQELDAVALVDGIDIAAVMALTKDLPAKATGRVNGRFPLQIGKDGLRLGTGWLTLKPGVAAEIQFNASGLLTGGVSPGNPSYAVLQKVESGLLKLAIKELRLDIRPPNAPPGRSATLHIAGEPVNRDVKAPVTLDLNVNGPLEKLLNMGMDSRLNFGAGK